MDLLRWLYEASIPVAGYELHWLELIGVLFGLGSAIGGLRRRVWAWPIGIIGNVLLFFVYITVTFDQADGRAPLFGQSGRQIFFILTSIYGWWKWLHGGSGGELPVRFSPPRLLIASAAAATVVALGYGWLLLRFTDAYAPFLDSVVLAFSVLGQLLMMERRVENWWAWLLVNTIAVPLYASRDLYLTAVLYAAFWINAVVSLRKWTALARASPG